MLNIKHLYEVVRILFFQRIGNRSLIWSQFSRKIQCSDTALLDFILLLFLASCLLCFCWINGKCKLIKSSGRQTVFLYYAQLSRVLNDSSTSGRQIVIFDAKSIYLVRILAESRTSGEGKRSLGSAGCHCWQIRRPAAQSKLRELRQRARSACFGQVTAIYKHYYLAEGGTFL